MWREGPLADLAWSMGRLAEARGHVTGAVLVRTPGERNHLLSRDTSCKRLLHKCYQESARDKLWFFEIIDVVMFTGFALEDRGTWYVQPTLHFDAE